MNNETIPRSNAMNQHQLCASLRKFVWNDAECQVLSSFVTRDMISVDHSTVAVTQSGLLLQGVMGGGKTSVLKLLQTLLHAQNVVYMDCSTLLLSNRGEVERTLLAISKGDQRVILLDNIDFFPSTSKGGKLVTSLTMSSRSFTSAALAAMDDPNTMVIATCTNIQAVDASFLHNYRFGQPIKLGVPSRADRSSIFHEILTEAQLKLDCDVPELFNVSSTQPDQSHLQNLGVQELALRTQGFTACDIYKLMRDHIQHVRIHHSSRPHTAESAELSLRALLQAISLTVPSAGLQAQNAEVTRFIRRIDTNTPRTVLVGMDATQKHLLKCIATVVPELRVDMSDIGSLRKCSGIVLVGPSGSGKTALTEWLAQATHRHCKFMAVPCADLVHKVVGETERKLAEIFSTARELSPCIVLLDNLDMLLGASTGSNNNSNDHLETSQAGAGGARRVRSQRTRHQAVDRMLSTLLIEIDGLDSSSSASVQGSHRQPSVIVVATTSRMDCLDRALIRPGRLEEHIALTLPDLPQRRECILSLFDPDTQRLLTTSNESSSDKDADRNSDEGNLAAQRNQEIDDIARCTPQKSYAYLRALYQEATIAYARDMVFSKLSLSSNTSSGKEDFTSVLTAAGGSTAKLEFVCQYMLKRVKLF